MVLCSKRLLDKFKKLQTKNIKEDKLQRWMSLLRDGMSSKDLASSHPLAPRGRFHSENGFLRDITGNGRFGRRLYIYMNKVKSSTLKVRRLLLPTALVKVLWNEPL